MKLFKMWSIGYTNLGRDDVDKYFCWRFCLWLNNLGRDDVGKYFCRRFCWVKRKEKRS